MENGNLLDVSISYESNPQRIVLLDSPLPKSGYSPSSEIMSHALASSSKKNDKSKKTVNGGHLAMVQSEGAKDTLIDMSAIPGADASVSSC